MTQNPEKDPEQAERERGSSCGFLRALVGEIGLTLLAAFIYIYVFLLHTLLTFHKPAKNDLDCEDYRDDDGFDHAHDHDHNLEHGRREGGEERARGIRPIFLGGHPRCHHHQGSKGRARFKRVLRNLLNKKS